MAGLTRDALVDVLHADHVLARRYFYAGCHRMEPYLGERPQGPPRLPATEWLAERVMALPTGTAVGRHEIAVIGSIIRLAVGWAQQQQLAAARPGAAVPLVRRP